MFRVYPFAQNKPTGNSEFMKTVTTFAQDDIHDILIVIHPQKHNLSVSEMEAFVDTLNPKLAPLKLISFGGHPQDLFNIQGTYTRRSPYPHLSLQSTPYLKQVTHPLHSTGRI